MIHHVALIRICREVEPLLYITMAVAKLCSQGVSDLCVYAFVL